MNKAWQKYLNMATGLTQVTQKRAESVVRSLVKQGEIATDRTEKAVDELLSRSEANRKAVASIVRSETDRAVGRLGLVRRKEIDALERKVERLERQVGGASTGKKSTKKSGAKKSTAKTGARKSTKKRAKKGAKKSAAAKRSARKTAAKKTAGRAQPAKKTAPPSNPAS